MADWNAQDYHRHSSQQQKWAEEVLAKLSLRGDERVLDIGCGDGKVTAEIARRVPRGLAVGVDSSTEMLDFARTSFGDIPNLRFRQGDARSLDFQGDFDWVVSFACLHWVIDHRPVLAGIGRSLCPGGRLLLQFGGKGNAADMVLVVSRVTARPQWGGCFGGFALPWGFYSPEEYRPWMHEAGLVPTRVELIPKDMVHDGRAGLAGWLRTTWMPYLQRLATDRQQGFLDKVLDEYLQEHPIDGNGKVHLRMVRLEVQGHRIAPD
jgi:trans-aconitate 2-methyltransferase